MSISVSNTLLTNSVITNEALRVLRNKFVLVSRSQRNVDELFGQVGYKNGSTINVRIPVRFVSAIGSGINTNNSVETNTSLTIQQRNIGMAYSSKDLTLSIDLFKERFIEPAMAQLASDIDQDGFALFYQAQSLATPGAISATTGPAAFTGADLATLKPFLDAKARLAEQACPQDDQLYCAVTPSTSAGVVDGLKTLFQSATEIAEQYKRGLMGLAGGLEWVQAQTLPSFTTGTRTNVTPLVDGDQSGGSLLLKGTGTSVTAKQGDMFVVSNADVTKNIYAINPLTRISTGKLQVFTVQAGVTGGGGGDMTVTVTPAVSVTAPNQTVSQIFKDGSTITWIGAASTTTDVNLVWHKDAFLVAFCDLDTDLPGAEAYIARDTESKIALRMVRQYNSETDLVVSRLDVLYGWKLVRPVLAARVHG